MKLLVSWMCELGTYVSREFHYTMQDLLKNHGWRHMEPWVLGKDTASLQDRLHQTLGEIPEAVLFWETYDLFHQVQPALRRLGCRLAVFADDLHQFWGHESARQAKLRAFCECDLALTPYAYVFHDFYPELLHRKAPVWIPHSASPDFVLPYNELPRNAIFLSGFVGQLYPLRTRMAQLHEQGRYEIARLEHPGYTQKYDYENDSRVGGAYAETIRLFRAAFTDALTFHYIVAKYFEIPATGSLLVADSSVSKPLAELGFVEYEHYVPVSDQNLEEQIRCVLDEKNHAKFDEVRRRGQQLVINRHTTRDRARMIDEACTSV